MNPKPRSFEHVDEGVGYQPDTDPLERM